MARLTPRDKLLLWTLVPIWVLTFSLHVREVARTGLAQLPIYAAPGAGEDAYPTVGSFRLETESGGTGLELGDRLIRVGDVDLRGVGFYGFDAIAYEQAGAALAAPLVFERDGVRRETVLRPVPYFAPWQRIPGALLMVPLCILIFVRAPRSRTARYTFVGVICYGIVQATFYGGSRWQTWASGIISNFGSPIAVFLIFRWLIHFPEEVPERRRLSMAWAWVPALYYFVVRLSYVIGFPIPAEYVPRVSVSSNGFFMLQSFGILVWNYRHADPIGRRRVKWAALGGAVVAASIAATALIPVFAPDFEHFHTLSGIATMTWVAPPLGFVIGILRYNLFDIDRLLSAAAAYSILIGGLFAGLLALVPPASAAVASTLGLEASETRLPLAIALAAAVVPLFRWSSPRLQGFFFPERRILEQGVEELMRRIEACRDGSEVISLVGRRSVALLGAERGVTYLLQGEEFLPFRTVGCSEAPAFPGDGGIVWALDHGQGPLALGDTGSRTLKPRPKEAWALAELGVQLLVPLRCGAALEAFVALGPKRSGDVYTSTDLSLLAVVAEKASAEMLRHRDAEIIAEERRRGAELEALKEAAERANLSRSRFLAAATHDLRQPLRALGLFIEALDERLDDAAARELVDHVRSSTHSLSDMFDALLDMSRLDAGAVEPRVAELALDPLLERLAADFAPSAREKGLALRVEPSGAVAASDPVLLGRILRNLLANAIQYTERGQVTLGAAQADGSLRVEVRDTGPGIPESRQREIFDEFVRLDEQAGGGLGLGLSIVRRLAALLGHPLELESKPGAGACFAVGLPAGDAAAQAAPTLRPEGLSGRLVVVLESDEALLTGLRDRLRRWGCDVIAATSVEPALAGLVASGRMPDAVLAARELGRASVPPASGLQAIAAIRAFAGATLPALVSSDASGAAAAELRAQGFVCLRRPVSPPQLRAALTELLTAPAASNPSEPSTSEPSASEPGSSEPGSPPGGTP